MNQIVQREGRDLAAAETREIGQANGSASMLAMIAEAARDPTVDAQKMVTLADLAIKLQDREQVQQYRSDKAKAIMEMPAIRRDGRIVIPAKGNEPERVQGRFAKWESLQAVISPILAKHNLVLSHRVGGSDTRVMVSPVLTHTNGFEEVGDAMPLPLDTSGGKNNTQAAGSSQSYGMRYSTCAMLNIRIAGVDDDASGRGEGGDRSERYTQEQRDLIDDGRSAAMDGPEAYEKWFRGIPAAARGWLAMEGEHDKLKAAAEKA